VPARPFVRALRYRYLLATILLSYVVVIALPLRLLGPARVAILGALLVMVVHLRHRPGSWTRPALVMSVVLLVATVVSAVLGDRTVLTCVSQASTALLVVLSVVVLVESVIAGGTVDGNAVQGVLCIYLLLALFFASVEDFAAALDPHFLNGAATPPNASETLYFSIVTLTTVGYGDITPATNLGRAVAASEALIGLLDLVSVVAVVVSRFRPARPLRRDPDPPPPGPGPAPSDRELSGPGGDTPGPAAPPGRDEPADDGS
jgi:voltage-gated potassium channel Kch